MVNKPRLVAVEHAVEAEREKLAPVALLNQLLTLLLILRIIHIEQVAQPIVIVVATSHIALFFCYDFSTVLHYESTLGNFLHRNQAPHNS